MGSYTADRIAIPVGLDEAGLRLGLQRLPSEELSNYRKRLLAEARDAADPSEASYIRGIGRKVGVLDEPVLSIDLVLDSDGKPLASDPFVEVTSTYLRAYSDKGNSVLDIEVCLEDRGSGYWLSEIVTAFGSSTYFTISTLLDYKPYLRGNKLRFGNSERYYQNRLLLPSYQNQLGYQFVRLVRFSAVTQFNNLVGDLASVVEDGDYYVDTVNGVVFSNSLADGNCSFIYAEFPYVLHAQEVRAVPLNDADLKRNFMDTLISDETGLSERVSLSPYGAYIYNRILAAHPLGWGA